MPSRVLGLACLMPLWLSVMSNAAENYSPRAGQPHPAFTLPRIDNREPVALSQYRGKKVLLIQFASW